MSKRKDFRKLCCGYVSLIGIDQKKQVKTLKDREVKPVKKGLGSGRFVMPAPGAPPGVVPLAFGIGIALTATAGIALFPFQFAEVFITGIIVGEYLSEFAEIHLAGKYSPFFLAIPWFAGLLWLQFPG